MEMGTLKYFLKRKVCAKRIYEGIICLARKGLETKDLSYKERMEDAQASGAEEGRDKLRKAAGSRK